MSISKCYQMQSIMKTKLLLLLCCSIITGCQTSSRYRDNTLMLIEQQRVTVKTEYGEGWNAALKNLEHHLEAEKTPKSID